jgi:hypothetical protein
MGVDLQRDSQARVAEDDLSITSWYTQRLEQRSDGMPQVVKGTPSARQAVQPWRSSDAATREQRRAARAGGGTVASAEAGWRAPR